MNRFAAALAAIFALGTMTACESASQNDGVSRFALSPYHGPGSPPVLPPQPDGQPKAAPEQGSI